MTNYNQKKIIDTIKRFYPIEIEIPYSNIQGTFFKKESRNQFLAFNFIHNSETEFVIYLFKSEFDKEPVKFIEDFNQRDIAFNIDDFKTLEIILNANDINV